MRSLRRFRARLVRRCVLSLVAVAGLGVSAPAAAQERVAASSNESADSVRTPLRLEDVIESIESTYPPTLAARMERDLREGRLRSARSLYDLDLFGKVGGTMSGYYEYTAAEVGAEQFLGLWGSTVYGGYRLTTGEMLPDYYALRTQGSGEARVGLRVPLLKGGATDAERARAQIAELGAEGAEPFIARQRLDFARTGAVAYFKWLAAGQKLSFAESLLTLAESRTTALEEQVANGLRPDIVLVDNRRLVVSRELDVIEAERDFEAAALVLSLLFRTPDGGPVTPGRDRLPDAFPAPEAPVQTDVVAALERRPELRALALEVEQVEVEARLAGNAALPVLDARVEAARNYGDPLYLDRSDTEVRGELAFKMPLQRRENVGKQREVEAKLGQVRQKLSYAEDKVAAEVQSASVALAASFRLIDLAELNASLALQLQEAEQELFRLGSSDLLALQIREQATFDAQVKTVDAYLQYFTARADYLAAIADGVQWPAPGS